MQYFQLTNFRFLYNPGLRECYNTMLSNVAYGRLKTNENFKLLALKVVVVAVTYERCSLTRGSKYGDLAWKRLVFWKTGR